MSSLGIFNKETKTYQKVAGTVEATVVDAEMSDQSTNTVQNKVIKKYIDDSNKAKLDKSSVVDNQLASESGYALDARQANPNVDGSLGAQIKAVNETVNTLKKSVSDGKTKVANAITDKGVETATDATFDVMAENISKIETGGGELHGATISVTTTEETLVGMTITLSLNDTVVATRTFDDNGACSFTDIQEPCTYSLYSTDGTNSNTITVDITAENVINKTVISCEFYLTPDGETITPVDDVAILLKCAEIKDKSYTTMDELLADEQAMGDITMSENAMKYLARSTGFADAVCANKTFMTYLGASAYVDDTALNSDLWVEQICNSIYMEKIFHDLIPAMTSDTCSVGSVTIADYVDSRSTKWALFDKNEAADANNLGTYYSRFTSTSDYSIREFTFNQPVKIFCIKTVTLGHVETGSSSLNDAVFEVFAFKDSYKEIATVIQKQYPIQLCYNLFVTNLDNITKIKVVSHAVKYSNDYFALNMSELYLYGR